MQPVQQTSPTAGTIFHATKLPLTWRSHPVVTAKNGISNDRRLGVKADGLGREAKIMAVMATARGGDTA